MNTYKITNITNLLGKRKMHYNTTLNVEYVDNMNKKFVKIKPNETIFLSIKSLPLSLQRLRLQNLITVIPISITELKKELNAEKNDTIKNDELIKKSVSASSNSNRPTISTKSTIKKKSTSDNSNEIEEKVD